MMVMIHNRQELRQLFREKFCYAAACGICISGWNIVIDDQSWHIVVDDKSRVIVIDKNWDIVIDLSWDIVIEESWDIVIEESGHSY